MKSQKIQLADACKVVMGQSPPGSSYNTSADGLPFFQGKADFGDLHPAVRVFCNQPSRIAEAGDILISVRAPVGPTNLALRRCCIGRGLAALRPTNGLDSIFLLYFLRYYEARLASRGLGSTFGAINRDDLETLAIPLPELSEQRRIARRLEQADRLRRTRRYALELSDTFLPAAFLKLFGDLDQQPSRWERIEFDEVCKVSELTVDPKDPVYSDLPQISSEDIESVSGDLGPLQTARQKGVISVNFLVQPEEILFSKIRPKLRKVTHPGFKALCSADIYPIRVVHLQCHLSYLLFFMRSDYFSRIVARLGESRSNIPKVNRDELSEQAIPLPPLPLQQKFAALVERVERLRAVQRESLRQAEHLFASLLHRAFMPKYQLGEDVDLPQPDLAATPQHAATVDHA